MGDQPGCESHPAAECCSQQPFCAPFSSQQPSQPQQPSFPASPSYSSCLYNSKRVCGPCSDRRRRSCRTRDGPPPLHRGGRNLQVNNNTNKTFNHCLTTTQRHRCRRKKTRETEKTLGRPSIPIRPTCDCLLKLDCE